MYEKRPSYDKREEIKKAEKQKRKIPEAKLGPGLLLQRHPYLGTITMPRRFLHSCDSPEVNRVVLASG